MVWVHKEYNKRITKYSKLLYSIVKFISVQAALSQKQEQCYIQCIMERQLFNFQQSYQARDKSEYEIKSCIAMLIHPKESKLVHLEENAKLYPENCWRYKWSWAFYS